MTVENPVGELITLERQFVGYFLGKPEELAFIQRKPQADLFACKKSGAIYAAILKTDGQLMGHDFGLKLGLSGVDIVDYMQASPISQNMEFWAEQLNVLQVAMAARAIADKLASQNITAQTSKDYLDGFQKEMTQFELMNEQSSALVGWNESLDEWGEGLVKRSSADFKPMLSGFPTLDTLIDGFHPEELYTVAARTGAGKSAFLKSVMLGALKDNPDLSVLIFSVEMSRSEIISRISAEVLGMNTRKFRKAEFDEREWDLIHEFKKKTRNLKINFTKTQAVNLNDMKSIAKACKIRQGLDMILVDYIQKIPSHNNRISRLDNLYEISFGLKELSQNMKCSVIAAAQVGRKPENEKRTHYLLSDIADCGSIENDSDQIMFIERPGKYDMAVDNSVANIVVKKNRHGEENVSLPVVFRGHIAGFAPKSDG